MIQHLNAHKRALAPWLAIVGIAAGVLFYLWAASPHNVAFATGEGCDEADAVAAYLPGPGNLNPAANALGPADGSFVSVGQGGVITLEIFNGIVVKPAGSDFSFDFGLIGVMGAELKKVEVSGDGITYFPMGGFNTATDYDIRHFLGPDNPLTVVHFVRITDDGIADGTEDSVGSGYDVDSLEVYNCVPDGDGPVLGRMTGGGSIILLDPDEGTRITRGFQIHCDLREPNNLQVNRHGADSFRFHMTSLDSAICLETEATQFPPDAPFDTFIGTGTGKLNGKPGATVEFVFVDWGEPGENDLVKMRITSTGGVVVLEHLILPITKGNLQAHADK